MKLNSKFSVVAVPLLGVLATGFALSAPGSASMGTAHTAKAPHASALDDDEDGDNAEPRELDLRDVMPMAKLSLSKAVALALATQPGAAVEAGIEGEIDEEGDLAVFFEVMIVGSDKNLHEVKVSHLNGTILENGIENDEEDANELAGFTEALRHSELTLTQLIASAGKLVNGQAASASLELDDEGPECEVLVVNGRYLVDIDVEARAGHIVEIELAGLGGGDEDECGGRDEDDDGNSWGEDEGHDDVQKGHHDDDDNEGDDEDEGDDD